MSIAGIKVRSIMDLKILRDERPIKQPYHKRFADSEWTVSVPAFFKVLIIWGPTGTGKTQWAAHQFENPFICREEDSLREFDPQIHDGIVFDDISFRNKTREACIHLVDWDEESQIRCRYHNAIIPRCTRKIFTCNFHPFSDPVHALFPPDDSGAIRRRISRIIQVRGPTFRTVGRKVVPPLEEVINEEVEVVSVGDVEVNDEEEDALVSDWDGLF